MKYLKTSNQTLIKTGTYAERLQYCKQHNVPKFNLDQNVGGSLYFTPRGKIFKSEICHTVIKPDFPRCTKVNDPLNYLIISNVITKPSVA